ncbi:MAG: TIGR03087 family PEP-CTERM/XrtA system glycosyltransferase [Phycisphaerales bacterium]|nr:MAG: TIGR03087 family PEP-CTERM/XrtA system glycosyltransferase [Phycisphaerales bacterium]
MRLLLIYPRMPYPPERGDKIRTSHQFAFLAERHEVWCACFVDDLADWAHVGDCARMCAQFEPVPLSPWWSAAKGLVNLLRSRSVSEGYLESTRMKGVVDHWSRRTDFDAVLCFGAGMGPYGLRARARRRCLDLCDLDSLKWRDYARRRHAPARWLYAWEHRRVAELEMAQVDQFDAVTLITRHEASGLRARLDKANIHVVGNGVETAQQAGCGVPAREPVIAFVGAMDYWPNEDAVCWFADSVWPALQRRVPEAEWIIVGRNPRRRVSRLGDRPGIMVTGRVPDVVSYLRGARVVIAPLRVARGLQNKVLEGMACGRPVVASRDAARGIAEESLPGLAVADTREEWISTLEQLLVVDSYAEQEGLAAQAWVRENFSWPEQLERMERILLGPCVLETRRAAAKDVLVGRSVTAEVAV